MGRLDEDRRRAAGDLGRLAAHHAAQAEDGVVDVLRAGGRRLSDQPVVRARRKRGGGQLSRRVSTPGGRKGRRGSLIRVLSAVAFVSALLYWEQTELLYVLSTLAVCGLLLVVAFSDLEGRGW